MAAPFPDEYELEYGFRLKLEYMSRLKFILLMPLWIFFTLQGDLVLERPWDAVIETPDGETFKVPAKYSGAVEGVVGLLTIWNPIREIGLLPWLVERRDKTWSVRKKQIARYDELIRLVEEAANDA